MAAAAVLSSLMGCETSEPAPMPMPMPMQAGAKEMPYRLGIARRNDVTVLTDCSGDPILITFKRALYTKDAEAPRAETLVYGTKWGRFNETTIESIEYSFRGETWKVPLAKAVVFPDARAHLGYGNVVENGWHEVEDKEVFDANIGAARDERSGTIAIVFSGSDGENSYLGAAVVRDGEVLGIAMSSRDVEDSARSFARKSLSKYKKLK